MYTGRAALDGRFPRLYPTTNSPCPRTDAGRNLRVVIEDALIMPCWAIICYIRPTCGLDCIFTPYWAVGKEGGDT